MSIKKVMAKFTKAHDEAKKGNVNAFDEAYAPDVLVHLPPYPDTKGLEMYKQASAAENQGLTDIRIVWEENIHEGNNFAYRYTSYAKHTGVNPTLPAQPTGKEIIGKGCAFCHVKNNKIVEIFWYVDLLGFLQQLGVIPPMGQK